MYQRQYGPPQQADHPCRTLKTHPSYQCTILEQKGELSHETWASGSSGNKSEPKSDSNRSDNKSGKGSSNSKQKNTTPALPRARAQLLNRRSHHSRPFFETQKDRKLTPQECQCHLDNKLCLFCGTAGHISKDCPKSSLASAKAQASKSDQDKSTSSSTDLKKDWAVLRLCTTWGLCWTPLCENSYSQCIHSNLDSLTLPWHLTPFWIWSWNPCGFQIFRLFIHSVFVQT